MKEIGPIFRSLLRSKLGAILIVLQIALTMAIITNAAFIVQQRAENMSKPTGLDEENTASFVTNVFDSSLDMKQLYQEDLDFIRAIPGVVAATSTQSLPASGSGWGSGIYTDPEHTSDQSINFGNFMVDEHGLATFDLELVAGRNFRPDELIYRSMDSIASPDVAIVSQAMADAAFPDGNALGRTVYEEPGGVRPMQIIGIYDHMQNAWPGSDHLNRTVLMPIRALFGGEMLYLVRAEPGQLDSVMQQVETYLVQNRGRMLEVVRSFSETKRRTYSGDIAMVKLLTAVMVVLGLVTGLGIVGLAWFSVTQRRKQIGTRRALGATKGDVMRYFMMENLLITTAGLLLGVAGAVGLNWFLDTNYSVGRVPLWYLPLGMLALWVLGQLAVLLPARKAANVPPALATRSA